VRGIARSKFGLAIKFYFLAIFLNRKCQQTLNLAHFIFNFLAAKQFKILHLIIQTIPSSV
ncbi:hypothetical protein, partial [Acinetobacter johnsonii]|uniref:hypothetical protein n=1 Tax=Acinetobacter johnsonii TaxID=40214 RepID=UPI0032B35720